MTENQFRRQINRVLSLNNELIGALGRLGTMASEVLGSEYVADLCEGGEIEFRPIEEDGVADDGLGQFSHTTIYEEDIFNMLRGE